MKLLTTSLLLILSIIATAQTTWFEIPTNTNKKLNTISFGSSEVGYIGGNDSLLLKTTDGGQTWTALTFSGVDFSSGSTILNLKFVSESTGFMVVSQFSGSYKTTDGGLSWNQLPVVMCFQHALFFWDAQNGFVGGAGCFQGEQIDIYTDGMFEPATINTPTFDAADMVVDIDFLDMDFGMAVSQGRFLRTTDGGQTWDTIPTIDPDPMTSIEIVNDTLVYAGYVDQESAGYGLHVSHDGGLTWEMETEMATFAYPDYNDVMTTANGYIYSATNAMIQGMIFENKGDGWLFYSVDQPLYALGSPGDSTVFAVGDSGLVVTNLNPVLNVSDTAFDKNELSVYPNPAADELQFDIGDVSSGSKSEVRIWNLQGQVVLETSTSNTTVNISALHPGSYILEVQYYGKRFSSSFVKR